YIGVMKEIKVAAVNGEQMFEAVGEGQGRLGDVAGPINADAGLAELPAFLSCRRSIKEALHERQEGDELLVVTLLKLFRADVELAVPVLPGIRALDAVQDLPMSLHRRAGLDRYQLHRPHHD